MTRIWRKNTFKYRVWHHLVVQGMCKSHLLKLDETFCTWKSTNQSWKWRSLQLNSSMFWPRKFEMKVVQKRQKFINLLISINFVSISSVKTKFSMASCSWYNPLTNCWTENFKYHEKRKPQINFRFHLPRRRLGSSTSGADFCRMVFYFEVGQNPRQKLSRSSTCEDQFHFMMSFPM